MKRSKQLTLKTIVKPKRGRPRIDRSRVTQFGGTLLKGHARYERPLSKTKPIHLTLRASNARGQFSFLNKRVAGRVLATVNSVAKAHKIKIYRYQNVGNHLHLVIKLSDRNSYRNFIRSLTCKIKFGIEKIFRVRFEKFWDFRPHTRILNWGKDFGVISDYILKNELDSCGIERSMENLKILKFNLAANRLVLLAEYKKRKNESGKIPPGRAQLYLF